MIFDCRFFPVFVPNHILLKNQDNEKKMNQAFVNKKLNFDFLGVSDNRFFE